MPRQDGTGPQGKGPKTGRGMGPCNTGTGRGVGKVTGHVVAIGELKEATKCTCDENSACELCRKTKYIIIRLKDGGLITQYDYGSDIRIADEIEVQDEVMLMSVSNWSAEWQKVDKAKVNLRELKKA